jgi:cation-transporting ATPase I
MRLPTFRSLVRTALGQRRQISTWRQWGLVEMRSGAREDDAFLQDLVTSLAVAELCEVAVHVPEIDRLVLKFRADAEQADLPGILRLLDSVERRHRWHHGFFSTHTRFPEERTARYRALLEAAMDLASFSTGLLIGRINERYFRLFTELSALSSLIDSTPELRHPVDAWLGEENTELLLRLISNISESFSQGWSGSLVDLLHRLHQWQAENQRQMCWESLRERCLPHMTSSAYPPATVAPRPVPVPEGAVETYQSTAEKLSLAAFSTSMAFTHNLSKSTATLFSSIPRPALRGRATFCQKLTGRLAEGHILVLAPEVLELLDRVDRVVIDAALVQQTRLAITSVYREGRIRLPLTLLEQLLTDGQIETDGHVWQLGEAADTEAVPPRLRQWWSGTGQPLAALRLVRSGHRVVGGFILQKVTDHTVESVLARVRSQGLIVNILSPEDNTGSSGFIREAQLQQHTVLALGRPGVIAGADVAIGILAEDQPWPTGAHLLVIDPLDALWRLLDAVALARHMATQSVELAKIDAFSGLILSLDKMDRPALGRIRLAANLTTLCAMLNAWRLARSVQGMPQTLVHDATPWHAMDVDTVIEHLQQLDARRTQVAVIDPAGKGSPAPRLPSLLHLWLEEMTSPLVPVLLTGAGLAAFTGALGDAALIGSVIALNGLVGGLQRRKTERQLSQMGMTTEQLYPLRRCGEERILPADQIQAGDILLLDAGDVVPADARLLNATSLEMDESSLTGESLPVKKKTAASFQPTIAERSSMLYEGTVVVQGKAEAVVIAERSRSEARRTQVYTAQHFNGVEARLNRLTELTVPVAAFSGIAILLAGLSRNLPVRDVIGSGVSLAVAAVPEGLPIMATLAQLASASRLGKKGALARNPRAIEALGRMTVLCADKTGTLTEGTLALRLVAVDGEVHGVEALTDAAREVLLVGLLASPEGIGNNATSHVTDEALGKAMLTHEPGLQKEMQTWQRAKELPFKSERGYHACLFTRGGSKRLCLKGAPEILLERCNRWQQPNGRVVRMNEADQARFTQLGYTLAARGYRILAVAERPARSLTLNRDKVTRLIFRGFLALADPVRPSARAALKELLEAGIRVKMITGDHPVTAEAIARELSMAQADRVMTGAQLEALDDGELANRVAEIAVFARVTPAQKARIVKALQSCGEVVGMTGDGANDAAAIRLAEVGIALGEHSSVAAQQAADLLVLDGRIETIVTAVLEGRALWTSVRDAVSLLVGGNLGEIGFTLIAGLLEGQSPLNARQLLLINLLTDTIPALAVALRKPAKMRATQLMEEGPEASLGEALTREIQWRAGLTGSVTTLTWIVDRWLRGPGHASTVALLTLIGTQLTQTILVGKGSREVILSSSVALAALVVVVETPGLARVFGCTPPGLTGWL